MKMSPVECPTCGAKIEVPEDVVVGEVLLCKDCGTEVEVVEVKGEKVIVQLAEAIGEDWGE